jgi:hypothetical protein
MKKLLATILVTAAGMALTNGAAATGMAKAEYDATKEKASVDYKISSEKCATLTGNSKDVCAAEAVAARTRTTGEAKAQYENTPGITAGVRKDIAAADYEVAKAKCGSKTGNVKDVCIKEAKSAKVATVENAVADKKIVNALVDAQEDKQTAQYKVALEKCDAQSGAAKALCVTTAKSTFGK